MAGGEGKGGDTCREMEGKDPDRSISRSISLRLYLSPQVWTRLQVQGRQALPDGCDGGDESETTPSCGLPNANTIRACGSGGPSSCNTKLAAHGPSTHLHYAVVCMTGLPCELGRSSGKIQFSQKSSKSSNQ